MLQALASVALAAEKTTRPVLSVRRAAANILRQRWLRLYSVSITESRYRGYRSIRFVDITNASAAKTITKGAESIIMPAPSASTMITSRSLTRSPISSGNAR